MTKIREIDGRTCQKGLQDPSWEDCRECAFASYGRNCHNIKIPAKNDFTQFFSGLADWEKKIITIKQTSDSEIRALEGYTTGSPAVKVTWGYSTGTENGPHSFSGAFAEAELGVLDKNGEFQRVAWTEEDLGKNIFTKHVIGWPKEYEGWDPENGEEEIDWEAFDAWVDSYCRRVLS